MNEAKLPRAFFIVLGSLVLLGPTAPDSARAGTDLAGRVLDKDGKPLARAAVFIYTAAPKVGISPFCPSCYPDCGKQGITTPTGSFLISALSDSLLFRVLVTARGYEPVFVARVDPKAGPIEVALARRDPRRIDPKLGLEGRVLDPAGRPVVGATVTPVGYQRGDTMLFGRMPGTDPLSITDQRGRFGIATNISGARWFLRVMARGLAPRALQDVQPGRNLRVSLGYGAAVTGRVMDGPIPVAGVSIGLAQADRTAASFVGAEEIGTDDQGRFTFANVAPGQAYLVFGKMRALGAMGSVPAETLLVGADGAIADAGDLRLQSAHRVRGRLTLSGGGQAPLGTRVILITPWQDAAVVQVDPEGRFEATGVPTDSISIATAVPGYRIAPGNPGFDPINASRVTVFVGEDLDDLELLLEPGQPMPQGYAFPRDKKR